MAIQTRTARPKPTADESSARSDRLAAARAAQKSKSEDTVKVVKEEQHVDDTVVIGDKVPVHKGLDVGTNTLISSYIDENGAPVFNIQRDAFFRIIPKSQVNSNYIKISLDKRGSDYIVDADGSFIVIGDDALDLAIERRGVVERPLTDGVISPKNRRSLPIIKLIIKNLLGTAIPGSKVVYSVPGRPVDRDFNVVYHQEILGMYLKDLGYEPIPVNETFAIALSELLDDGLSGLCVSMGAGLANVLVIHEGEIISEFSLARSGDYIDNSVALALDTSPSLVLQEKESGTDLYNPEGEIQDAIVVYYNNVIKYTLENIAYELTNDKKNIPAFIDGVTMVFGGGLTLADGFIRKVEENLAKLDFPMKISNVRLAESPLTAVSRGCLLAANL